MRIGYVRVSTIDQNPELQREAMRSANCDQIYEDKISGTKVKRPGLTRAIRTLKKGDTLVVWKLDRLGRSLIHLVDIMNILKEKGVEFLSLTEGIDTTTSMGRFTFHIMAALAEMERDMIVERTRAGLEAAKLEGRVGGRPPKLRPEEWEQIGRLIAQGVTRKKLAIIYDIGESTIYRRYPANVCHNTCMQVG